MAKSAKESSNPSERIKDAEDDLKRRGGGGDANYDAATVAFVAELKTDNYKQREKYRRLKESVESEYVKAEDIESIQGLMLEGESFSDFAERTRGAFKEAKEAVVLKQKEVFNEAAEIVGYNPKVLSTLLKADGLEVKVTKGDDDDDDRVVVIKDGKEKSIEKYAKKNWEDHMPSLAIDHSTDDGAMFPSQQSSDQPPKDGVNQKKAAFIVETSSEGNFL
jgi:hypothetical protein